MKSRTFLALTILGGLTACAYPGDALVRIADDPVATPGAFFPSSTIVRVPSADAGEFTYDYNRLTSNDFGYAIQAADRGCAAAGKKAHLATMGLQTQRVGRVTFVCL